MNTILIPVQTQDIDAIWFHVEPLVEKACQRSNGHLSSQEIKENLLAQLYQLFLIKSEKDLEGVIITQVVEYKGNKRLHISGLAGKNMSLWINHFETLKTWARAIGCHAVEMVGRKGWQRVLSIKPQSYYYLLEI